MAYRSLKRVLGETNLERKCRISFGICLVVLIFFTFFYVGRVAEDLVIETTRSKSSEVAGTLLQKVHFIIFETSRNAENHEFARAVGEGFERHQNYSYEVLTLSEEHILLNLDKAKLPAPGAEAELMARLKEKFDKQAAEQQLVESDGPDAKNFGHITPLVFEDRRLPGLGEYHYYEPVYWKSICNGCHGSVLHDSGAIAASDPVTMAGADETFHVVKVIVPYKETKEAINRTWAILWVVGIMTVFLTMVALYVIVRYVIVKPLKHLRDVSDDVSQGDLAVRAEIQTNDEFEELADSFNRMLRHLTDAQGKLQDVNTELDGKVDQLAQLNMRLYEMNRLKDDFLANMSHELRTPLNSIIGFAEVLEGIRSLDDKQRRYALNIRKSGRLLLEMINDILDLAKVEAGKMEVRPTEFAIDTIVGAQCDMVRALTEEKNIALTVIADHDAPHMYQDQAKVQQILTNLLSNAIKFTPEGGRITVRAHRDNRERLEMTVADTGVGIAEEDRETIFEKFRQSSFVMGDDGLTREHSGTGLGLSIIKELCKLLGGEISFESELGKGSTFKVVLPWTSSGKPHLESELTARLDELTAPKRSDFEPSSSPPSPISTSAVAASTADTVEPNA